MKKFFLINLFLLTLALSASAQTKSNKKPAARRVRPKATVVRTMPPPAVTGLGSGIGNANGRGIGAGNGSGIGNSAATGSGENNGRRTVIVMPNGEGVGNPSGSNSGNQAPSANQPELTPLMILDQPVPEMTEQARQNNVSGVVRLRVTFLPSGQIGGVSVVSGLPHGLTESAVKAAKEIKFQPARRDSILIPQTKIIEYTFPQN